MTTCKAITTKTNRTTPALLLLFATLMLWPSSTSGQIPDTALKRVLEIQVGDQTGTAFTVEVDEKQYLVTAKHLVAKLKTQDTIDIRTDDAWRQANVKVYKYDDPIDVAVLIADYQLTASSVFVELTTVGVRFGQEALFLGFPYDQFYTQSFSPFQRATGSNCVKAWVHLFASLICGMWINASDC
jgi:S1-C subfamily serine protease